MPTLETVLGMTNDLDTPNGFMVRGLNADADRVSIQSNERDTWALLTRKWAGLLPRRCEVNISRDELVVLKCNGGQAEIEIRHLGGPHGRLICDSRTHDQTYFLARGESHRFEMKPGQALVLRCEMHKYPLQQYGKHFVT